MKKKSIVMLTLASMLLTLMPGTVLAADTNRIETGDHSNMLLWLAILLASILAAIIVILVKRKKND